MDREIVLVTLALVLCGPMLFLLGAVSTPIGSGPSGRHLERDLWRRIWLPFIPAALVFAGLLGWALQEPEVADERILSFVFLIAAPFAVVWLRMATRAALAIRAPAKGMPAATVGFVRPRIVISRELLKVIDAAALQAAREHEAAHARHRDPLRIWVAQLVTDLKWPSLSARTRFRRWMHTLEIARDEEAREGGVDGTDLAAAVLAAARLHKRRVGSAMAGLTGEGEALEARIALLLAPVPLEPREKARGDCLRILLGVAFLLAVLAGVYYGDAAVRMLPGIAT